METTDKAKKILVIDIETTGLSPSTGKIIEIGIVELDLTNETRRIIFDSVVHETGITQNEVENSWIIKNSTLTVDAVRHSPRLDKLLPTIQSIINNYPLGVTAYNISFDVGFLKSRGVEFPRLLDCPMKLSTPICELPHKYPYMKGFKYPKVQEAYDLFFPNSDYVEEHRGADDAMHEAEIVLYLYKKGIFKV